MSWGRGSQGFNNSGIKWGVRLATSLGIVEIPLDFLKMVTGVITSSSGPVWRERGQRDLFCHGSLCARPRGPTRVGGVPGYGGQTTRVFEKGLPRCVRKDQGI